MIQDIGNAVYHVEYMPEAAKDKDIVFLFKARRVFAKMDEEKNMSFPTYDRIKDVVQTENLQFLFKIEDRDYYMYNGTIEMEGYAYENVGYLNRQTNMKCAFAAMTAYHLFVWYDSHRFCGKCGHTLEHLGKERALACPSCGNRTYPIIAPAVIIGVIRGDDILITRYAGREYKGVALLAGFCEIGESAEDTVRREVMEEVGLKIKNLRYFGSQPWGIDSNLLLGYFAEVDGSAEIHMDTQELREAVWMHREELKPAKNTMSLTMTMIEAFRTGAVL